MTDPRVLVVDIETSPLLVWTWGLFNQNIAINQIERPTRMLSWAAKWHGDKGTMFGAEWSHDGWVEDLRDLILEADAICHYNGKTFDYPHIRREVRLAGLGALPDSIAQIDLLKTVRKFRLASNKLDWAGTTFIGENKLTHTGFPLWKGVMDGDSDACELMEQYNRQDVELTDDLLTDIKPDVGDYLNMALFNEDGQGCSRCPSTNLQKRGYTYTKVGKYQRYQCQDCGAWSKGTRRIAGATTRSA